MPLCLPNQSDSQHSPIYTTLCWKGVVITSFLGETMSHCGDDSMTWGDLLYNGRRGCGEGRLFCARLCLSTVSFLCTSWPADAKIILTFFSLTDIFSSPLPHPHLCMIESKLLVGIGHEQIGDELHHACCGMFQQRDENALYWTANQDAQPFPKIQWYCGVWNVSVYRTAVLISFFWGCFCPDYGQTADSDGELTVVVMPRWAKRNLLAGTQLGSFGSHEQWRNTCRYVCCM